jgi:hypothetical protein
MIDKQQKKKPAPKGPIDAQRLVWHLEAALQEADLYDPMAGFMLRVTIESLRKAENRRKVGAQHAAA